MSEDSPKRPRVKSIISAKLARSIASGEFSANDSLPSEADLALEYGVSRTALREAIKILEAKNLITSRPRVGTVVLPQQEWSLLDADVLEWVGEYLDKEAFIDAVLQARMAIEPAAATLACKHASLEDLSKIEKAVNGMAGAGGNADKFTEADLEFHTALLLASHNLVFIQFIHLVKAALRLMLLASNKAVNDYTRTVIDHRKLLDAIVLRDEVQARKASENILTLARVDLDSQNSDDV